MDLVFPNTFFRKENSPVHKKKLLVYDTARGIASEIRKKISSDYDIYFCLKKGDDKKIELADFFAAIIIVNDIDDLKKIEEFDLKINNLIVSSSINKDYFNYPSLKNLIIFDLNLNRKSTISLIKEKLNYIALQMN